MKVAILAGGLGTRLSELTESIPKSMVRIGEMPILWHIMKSFAVQGHKEFVVALGYRGDVIKGFFLDYRKHSGSLTVDLKSGDAELLDKASEDWTVHLLETGLETMTGGRVKRVMERFGGETMLLTYGDGVAAVDYRELLEFHKSHGRLATVTAVRPPARFGGISFKGDQVKKFTEKPQIGEGWINGGYFVFEPRVKDYIKGDETYLEREPLERLAKDGQLMAYRHEGFWQCMDTLRDVKYLEERWKKGKAPWKTWDR